MSKSAIGDNPIQTSNFAHHCYCGIASLGLKTTPASRGSATCFGPGVTFAPWRALVCFACDDTGRPFTPRLLTGPFTDNFGAGPGEPIQYLEEFPTRYLENYSCQTGGSGRGQVPSGLVC